MNTSTYEAWKAREEDYRRRSRKRSTTSLLRAEAAAAWNATDWPTSFDEMIPTWQSAIVKYYGLLKEGVEHQQAWNLSTPSSHSAWHGELMTTELRLALLDMRP